MNIFNHEKLKKLRKEAKLTQADVAKKIGVARTTYADYENGRIQPPISKIKNICEVFGYSYDDLVNPVDSLKDVYEWYIDANSRERQEREAFLASIRKREAICNDLERIKDITYGSKLALSDKTLLDAVTDYLLKKYEVEAHEKEASTRLRIQDIIVRAEKGSVNNG